MEDFVQLNIETLTWHIDQFLEHYQINLRERFENPINVIAENQLETYLKYTTPEGVLYVLNVDGKVAGMGCIRKLSEELGEVKKMWNRPEFRGRGLGKMMVERLLRDGKEFGCSRFGLSTPRFAVAAQHLYKSFGFETVQEFPQVDLGDFFRPYYLLMEKKD